MPIKEERLIHRRVPKDDLGQSLLTAGHGRKRNRLGGLGDPLNNPGILDREKTFRDYQKQNHGEDQGSRGHHQSGLLSQRTQRKVLP